MPEEPTTAPQKIDSNLYDTQTRKATVVPEDKLQEALASGQVSYKAGSKINVVDPDGKSFHVDGADVSKALSKGYQLETPRQQAVREYVQENKGIGGAAKVGLEQFANQALFSIPETIYEKTGDPLEVAKYEALKKEHNIANIVGGVGGFAANLAVGGPVFDVAKLAGKATETALAARLVAAGVESGSKAIAKGIVAKTLGSAARMGVEGGVIAAPRAITEELLGDHELAAETLLLGIGAGGVLGGVGSATGALAGKFGKMGAGLIQKLAPAAEEGTEGLAGVVGPEATKALSDKIAKTIVGKASKIAGSALGSIAGGVVGHVPGAFIGHSLGEMAGNYAAEKVGPLFAEQAMKLAALKLDTIPEILEGMANKGFQSGARVSSNVFQRFTSLHDEDKNTDESFKRMSDNLATLTTQPDLLSSNIGALTGVIDKGGAPKIAEQYNQKQLNAVQYLQQQIPKNPKQPTPFSNATWKPTDQEMRAFQRKLEVVGDPFVVLNHLQAGTLTKDHVNALSAVFPKIQDSIRARIFDKAFEPTLKKMGTAQKQKLSLLTDIPMTDNNMSALQANFQTPDPQEGGGHNAPTMPDNQTNIQRLST